MYTKKGQDRFVLVLPKLGIAVKFPKIRLLNALSTIFNRIRSGRLKLLLWTCSKWAPESQFVISGMLLRGIVANQRERRLWKRTHNPFLQPTFFSLFGLFNIQQYGKPYLGHNTDLWVQVRKITHEDAYRDAHQFSEPSNYCVVDGKLRILDYGGRESTWVVLEYGKKIVNEFDFEYRYIFSPANNIKNS